MDAEKFDEAIFPLILNRDELDFALERLQELSTEQDINFKYVAWEYKDGINMPTSTFDNLFGKGSYVGAIFYDAERYRCENHEKTPYYRVMPETIRNQYCDIYQKVFE